MLRTIISFLTFAVPAVGQQPADLDKQRCPKPAEFALVFSFGYSADKMPADDERFETLLKKIKDARFNVVHCRYTDKRLALCKKHGIKMMVDLLIEEHHIYKNPKEAQALCEKLKNNPDIWGYNIWNDPFGKSIEGRLRDIRNVRTWDPTHPAFSGTYRVVGMKGLHNPDVFGYYDFHWKRGINQHFGHIMAYSNWGKERNAVFYTWLSCTSGLPGKGNFNRNLYSANTGIACGLKGVLWFLGEDMMNAKTLEWTEIGRDITKVQKEIAPLAKELPKLGHPSAIYSTPITKTPNNEPIKDAKDLVYPPGLGGRAFPSDFWIQPAGGEFVLGVFPVEKSPDAIFVANHNAYAEQKAALKIARKNSVEIFNRSAGKWQVLEQVDGAVRVTLSPGGGELLRLAK
ncbi:MAG: hypothetical protein FJ303_12245 [Planctomycetes bacterium]|nr:hypothetical protein [Planctomycetota bacterium]